MLDTVKNGLMAAVVEALEFMRLRMTLTPYYSEPSGFIGELGMLNKIHLTFEFIELIQGTCCQPDLCR